MKKKDLCIILDDLRFNMRVACFMECDGKILIHKPKTWDFWNLPGGRVQFCEDSLTALKRELMEEIGYAPTNCKFFALSENFFPFNGKDVHELLFIYKIKVDKSEPIAQQQDFGCLDKENVVFHWAKINEIKNYKCLPRLIYDIVNMPDDKFHRIIENDLK